MDLTGALRAEIFFGGTYKQDGLTYSVGENAFADFIRRAVTFPGFTLVEGAGYWNGAGELSRVLILYGPSTRAFQIEVRKIVDAYRVEFNQEAVAVGFAPAAFYLVEGENG